MTVFCLAELDGDAVAEASLRALTLARGLGDRLRTGRRRLLRATGSGLPRV